MSEIEKRLIELNYELPSPMQPLGNYVSMKRIGNLLYSSGSGAMKNGKPIYTGRLGEEITVEQGYEAAKLTALQLLSCIKHEIGSLDNIRQLVKMLAFVSCTDDFMEQPKVIDGASDLFKEILGEKGSHSRSAIGTNALPFNIPLEIELIIELEEKMNNK